MKKTLHTIGNILYGIVIAAVVVIILLFVGSRVGFLDYGMKIVLSGSMEPTIKTGSIILIHPEAAYTVGDIVTFGKDTKTNIPTTHRLVASHIENGILYFNTKGDANEDPDPDQITQKDIEGKVLFSIPYLGYVIDFAKHPLGFFLLVIVPALIIVLDEARKIFVEMRRMKAKKLSEERARDAASEPNDT